MKLGMSDVEMCEKNVAQKKKPRTSPNSVPGVFNPALDYEQSLFCSKIRGEEHKTSEQSWACERDMRSREPQVPRYLRLARSPLTVTIARSLVLRTSPRIFEENRDRSQSNPELKKEMICWNDHGVYSCFLAKVSVWEQEQQHFFRNTHHYKPTS